MEAVFSGKPMNDRSAGGRPSLSSPGVGAMKSRNPSASLATFNSLTVAFSAVGGAVRVRAGNTPFDTETASLRKRQFDSLPGRFWSGNHFRESLYVDWILAKTFRGEARPGESPAGIGKCELNLPRKVLSRGILFLSDKITRKDRS